MMEKWARIKYMPCIPLGEDGRIVTGSCEHIEISKKAANEGMVLLKNDGVLPLKHGAKIAIFGKAQIDYVKGGGGSGNVCSKYVRNIYDGFKIKEEEGKVEIFHKASEFYITDINRQQKAYSSIKLKPGLLKEPDFPAELVEEAADFADTALIVVCRFSAEEKDRTNAKGDYCLSEEEDNLVKLVCSKFKNVVILLNIGGVMDTSWFADNDRISGALVVWNAGMEGGLAIAETVCGDSNPSGKLTDTFAKHFDDYPASENFYESSLYLKNYEDIYIGYRYFETVPGMKDRVNYPFGFGLSYTEFKIYDVKAEEKDGKIIASCKVLNSGVVAGKEVVQVYYRAPQGKLGKSARELAGFKKTQLLAPGQSESVVISFDISSMASYDDEGKCQKSAYVLEGGNYEFYIGNSVRNTEKADFIYVVKENVRVVQQFKERMAPLRLNRRMRADGSFDEFPYREETLIEKSYPKAIERNNKNERITLDMVDRGEKTLDEFIAQLDVQYLSRLLGGKRSIGVCNVGGMGGDITTGDSMGVTNIGIDEYGVPCAMTCDGPAGVRINEKCGVYTTAFPCATMIACSWNPDIAEEVGRCGAMEAKENNFYIWLAPALNIHRSPLCGRNFEYMSEDPLVSGKIAAAIVRGIQSIGVAATPKHFACNNKEENREECDFVVSERALREIYLKGFEICVKESSPKIIMTAFNKINGHYCSENYEMLTEILRNEWGFEGLVITDWHPRSSQICEIKAGNDVRMPSGYPEPIYYPLYFGSEDTFAVVQQSAKRLLKLLLDFE